MYIQIHQTQCEVIPKFLDSGFKALDSGFLCMDYDWILDLHIGFWNPSVAIKVWIPDS
jgi:hypothetical protein